MTLALPSRIAVTPTPVEPLTPSADWNVAVPWPVGETVPSAGSSLNHENVIPVGHGAPSVQPGSATSETVCPA